jgi:3-hydroxyisobutyrate dehydrogenase-like beta-hydroxyacid dehydrogenase
MTPPAVGFIGFGEAGSTLARGLRSAGVESLAAFDIKTDAPDFGPLIQQRAAESRTILLKSPAELAGSSDVIFSTVTSTAALEAARQTVPYLRSHHIYADLNSVSPALKQVIDRVISGSGARFVEVAVMAPVLPYGHRVPMLIGGTATEAFIELMAPFGLRLDVVGSNVGVAAAVKMCRSIVVKGLEALMVECVLGACSYGADELVFASLNESLPGIDWQKLADYMVGRVVVHGERRAREMEEVAETLRAIGIDPIMAEATARRHDWTAHLDLRLKFGPEGPATYREALALLPLGR